MPDSRFNLGPPGKGTGLRRRPKAAEAAPLPEASAPEAKAKAGSPAAPVASFETLFGQRFQASKLSESDTLARLAGQAIGRLPGLDPKGPLAAQVASGRLNSEGIRMLQAALNAAGANLGEDGQYGPKTHAALSKALKSAPAARPGRSPKPKAKPAESLRGAEVAPEAVAKPKPTPRQPRSGGEPVAKPIGTKPRPSVEAGDQGGSLQGLGGSLEGRSLRRTSGRATTFANGHIPYKGWIDVHNKQNRGIGAWGDKCAPTEYFCALPDPLGLGIQSAKWWHNKKILVTNPENGKQVVVRIQDKGPHGKTGAAIDLSPIAMEAIGGALGGSLGKVNFQFADQNAPVGPVR